MAKEYTLEAKERTLLGRKSKRLRKEGILPSNLFGKSVKSLAIEVNTDEFTKLFKEVGETAVVSLKVGSKSHPVLIHNTQVHPVTGEYVHVDFLQVNLKEKVKASIPVELIGESPAEKQGLGALVQQINEVEVEALPNDLPESFELDVSVLDDTEKTLTVGDIKSGSNVEVLTDNELIVAKVDEIKEEVEEPVAPTEGVEEQSSEAEKSPQAEESGSSEKEN